MVSTQRGYDISGLFVNGTTADGHESVAGSSSLSADDARSGSVSSAVVQGFNQFNRDRPSDKPLLWEWRYSVAGPCWNDAPQLAIRIGRYKLLMDPPTAQTHMHPSATATVDGGLAGGVPIAPPRVELYDFGATSAAGSAASNALLFQTQNLAAILPDVVANLSASLLKWHASLPPGPTNPHPGCGGIEWPTGSLAGAGMGRHAGQTIIEDDPAAHL
jgi:hypothetical protein